MLTGIRGIAAVWVCLFHFYPWVSTVFGVARRGQVPFVRDGFLGVDLFFLLSGFVLMLSYGPRLAGGSPRAIGRFLLARGFRILPMHWAMLGILAVIVGLVPGFVREPFVYSPKSFLQSLLLVQGLMPDAALAWNRPTWSTSDEALAYLLFPLLAPLIGALRTFGAAFTAAVLALLSLWLIARYVLHAQILNLVYPGGPVRCLCEFSAGAFACRAWQLGETWIRGLGSVLTLAGLLALAAAIRYSSHLDLFAPFALLALVVASGARARAAWFLFGGAVAVFLGEISYSLYLIHLVLFDLLALPPVMRVTLALPAWGQAGLGLLVWCVLVLLSWLGYRHVEQPFRICGRKAVQSAFPLSGQG